MGNHDLPVRNHNVSMKEYKEPQLRSFRLPPSPPVTEKTSRSSSVHNDSDTEEPGCESHLEGTRMYPLPPPCKPDNTVLQEDLKTPDSHVVRDPRLIRLTGVHPFNVEPPLSDLYNEGFLTSKDLHYVRNHGPVPQVEDSDMLDWEFTIEGEVENPVRISLAEMMEKFEQVTYPVTLVCAGNRRKEQNMVRKSKGFSWGAAGLSTALWTGVVIGDLLKAAMPKRGAKYVCFEGADKLPNGYYGTSIKLNWAMDPNRGVMVAHKMNGETLHPDHGKPVRIVIPGQIGGRSVKWLKRIIVTKEPSDNWYHYYDNRVLPTTISPEESANMPETWKDERYAIYDLNTNSATCYPAHGETVSLTAGIQSYKVRGYAYAGGGRRISRMEVTLDKGKSWTLANVLYPEDEYRLAPEGETLYGGRLDMSWRESCFCWCFWELDIPMAELATASDISVRAMDEAMMVQPKDMYWSVLGMMNNPWFRVVIHREGDVLRFEHPTQPALIPGGWMERVKKAGGNLTNGFWGEKLAGEEQDDGVTEPEPVKEICMVNKDVKRTISLEELRKHDGEDEPWFVVNGEVYDGTGYLEGHPGGAVSIINSAGQDASEEFLAIHSENAKAMLVDYHIGTLSPADRAALAQPAEDAGATSGETAAAARPTFLQAKVWSKAVLSARQTISADTKIFTFNLEHAEQLVGLPVGQHLMMRLRDPATREAIIRAYTPLPPSQAAARAAKGKLDVLVKVYYDGPGRPGGKMTQALDSIPVGHFVDFRGPVGKFTYEGKGVCSIEGGGGGGGGKKLPLGRRQRRVRRFYMLCGGSGVTPIFQVLSAVMADGDDATQCVVVDGNRTEADILCYDELNAMAEAEGKSGGNDAAERRCRVLHTLSQPGPSWTGRKGRMDKALLEEVVGRRRKEVAAADGEAEAEDLVLVCGPEPMEKGVRDILTELGWGDDDMVFF